MLVSTGDGHVATVPPALAAKCATLAMAPDGSAAVPLPNVGVDAMKHIIEYHARLEQRVLVDSAGYEMQAFKDEFFAGLERGDLFDMMEALNYLGATALLDDACSYVAALLHGRSPAQICDLFGLALGTAAEAADAAGSLSWAIK